MNPVRPGFLLLNTDWSKVRAADKAGVPVPYDRETDPYDPNGEAAARAFWEGAKL